MERKQGTAHYNNWHAKKQWNKNKVNLENVGGSSKEKTFEEKIPKLPIRNDKKKVVDGIHDKERQKNKFSVLTDVESDHMEEIKMMKDKMIIAWKADREKERQDQEVGMNKIVEGVVQDVLEDESLAAQNMVAEDVEGTEYNLWN
ncbi:hypothetical protein Tco_0679381 [Tanacetum coccineum]|uniref:Uncharacterized protein n=1 Tax=Tanacetum coccineum TaxID=301880 RepID=A0ABQ4XHT1_9ASTR